MTTMRDNAPHNATLSNGAPNPGSHEFTAFVGFVTQAHDILIDRGVPAESLPPDTVAALAGVLQDISDRVQHRFRADILADHAVTMAGLNGGTPTAEDIQAIRADWYAKDLVDRTGNSHTRARAAVYKAVEDFPLPAGQLSPDAVADWALRVENRAYGLLRIAAALAYTDRTETREDRFAALADALSPAAADTEEVA